MSNFNEIRLDNDGKEDDIVISCDQIHLERMDHGYWWLGIYKDNKRVSFSIINRQDGLNVELQENELKTRIVPLSESTKKEQSNE